MLHLKLYLPLLIPLFLISFIGDKSTTTTCATAFVPVTFLGQRKQTTTKTTTSEIFSTTVQQQDELTTTSNNNDNHDDDDILKNHFPLFGPSHTLNDLKIGGDPIIVKNHLRRRTDDDEDYADLEIYRLSKPNPSIFLLKSFLTLQECNYIINEMKNASNGKNDNVGVVVPMTHATTTTNGTLLRPSSRVGWLDNFKHHNLIHDMAFSSGELLLSNSIKECDSAYCESLQVVHYYEKGGEFKLHHDGLGRLMTIIYYLNGVGNTWFPFANAPPNMCPSNYEEATELCKHLKPGKDGIVIIGSNDDINSSSILQEEYHNDNKNAFPPTFCKIQTGDAIAFFNYENVDANNFQAWRAIHAGLPIERGEKWIANHWTRAPDLFHSYLKKEEQENQQK